MTTGKMRRKSVGITERGLGKLRAAKMLPMADSSSWQICPKQIQDGGWPPS